MEPPTKKQRLDIPLPAEMWVIIAKMLENHPKGLAAARMVSKTHPLAEEARSLDFMPALAEMFLKKIGCSLMRDQNYTTADAVHELAIVEHLRGICTVLCQNPWEPPRTPPTPPKDNWLRAWQSQENVWDKEGEAVCRHILYLWMIVAYRLNIPLTNVSPPYFTTGRGNNLGRTKVAWIKFGFHGRENGPRDEVAAEELMKPLFFDKTKTLRTSLTLTFLQRPSPYHLSPRRYEEIKEYMVALTETLKMDLNADKSEWML